MGRSDRKVAPLPRPIGHFNFRAPHPPDSSQRRTIRVQALALETRRYKRIAGTSPTSREESCDNMDVQVQSAEDPERDRSSGDLSLDHSGFLRHAGEALARGEILLARLGGGSMSPSILDGESVRVEHVAPPQLQIGDVVLYRSLSNTAVMHRIVRIEDDDGIKARIITQGDGCQLADVPVPIDRVFGRLVAVERHGQLISLSAPASGLHEQLRAIFSRNKPSSGIARES